jgi:phage shock protein A
VLQDGPDSNVWAQLLECCAEDPNLQPVVLRCLAQELAEHRAQTKQQLSAQQQVVAEQGVLIASLQDQLQELRAELQQYRQQHLPR